MVLLVRAEKVSFRVEAESFVQEPFAGDPDDPSIRLAYPLDKQIFDMNILIVVNLLEKKQPDLLHYL